MSTTKRRKARNPARKHPGIVPPTPKYVLVTNEDDWEGFYVDGRLVAENHRLDPYDIMRVMGIELETRCVTGEYLGETVCSLPERFTDIPAEAFHS